MQSLSEVYGGDSSRSQGTGIASALNRWADRLKEKQQKKALVAVRRLLMEPDIPMKEVSSLIFDAGLDPKTIFQGMEPMLKEKKKQQFSQVLPQMVAVLQAAETKGEGAPMKELFELGSTVGLGSQDVLIGLSMIQDRGLFSTEEQKFKEKEFRSKAYKHGAKYGLPLEPGGEVQFKKDMGLDPFKVPGAQEQALAAGATQGMPGPTIAAQQAKQGMISGGTPQHTQHFPGAPAQPKPPTSRAGLAATSMPNFKAMVEAEESIKAKHREPRAGDKEKLMSHPEERARRSRQTTLEASIVENPGSPSTNIWIKEFDEKGNDYTYRQILGKKGFGPLSWGEVDAKVEKVDISTPEKIRDSSLPKEQKIRLLRDRFGFE